MEKKDKLSERKLDNLLDEVDKVIKKLKITDGQFFYNVTQYFDDDHDLFTWNIPGIDDPIYTTYKE